MSPSIIYAALALARVNKSQNGVSSYHDLSESLSRTDAFYASLDYGGALVLAERIPDILNSASFTEAVKHVVLYSAGVPGTPWHRLAIYGIDVIVEAISDDVDTVQCLLHAGLLNESEDAYDFWDQLRQTARERLNAYKHDLGLRGERLSLEEERRELNRLEIPSEPLWVSRRDDTRGYDIQSYRRTEDGAIRTYFIEAKAHTGSRQFFLTRSEWRVALSHQDQYIIHLWDLRTETRCDIYVQDLVSLMPTEADDGRVTWQTVVVEWIH